jgi:O-antigen chain-terminating methyltransferase
VKELNERLKAIDERYTKNDSYLKTELTQQKRSLSLFLEEAQQRSPESVNQGQLQAVENEEQHLLDAFYTAFENQFRGEREDIFNRLKVYLPLLEEAKVGTSDFPILDVGCGRGEWLELLRESGYTATGLDHNRVMVDYCRSREFEVVEGDVIAYLRTLPDLSLGAVTGFHIIEHLPFPILIKLFNEVVRVLKPGGLAIFETPNPKNIVVGACNFYADPTHKNPLFPDTIQFILESQGLSKVKILYLNPVEGSPFNQEDASWQLLHNWFFCARDYAVVGYKL